MFARADQIDKNVQNMIKDFDVANVKPSTASCLLHQMEDCFYYPKAISNVIAKAKKHGFQMGVSTPELPLPKSWLIISQFLLTLVAYFCFMIQKRLWLVVPRKVVPKNSPMTVVKKYFNSQVVETEMIPQMSAEQYAIARRKALYLPESDCLLLYAAWITNKELRNTIMYPDLLAVVTTGDTTIEDRMLMIVAGLDNIRNNIPLLRAFLPSECQWVFHFLFSYVFPKLFGQGTVRRIKQVSPIVTQLSQHSWPSVAQSPLYET
jgi:hypothetical protein